MHLSFCLLAHTVRYQYALSRHDANAEDRPGTYLSIASFTCYLLLRRGKDCQGRRLMLSYTALMMVLTTAWIFSSAYSSGRELAGIRDPNVAYAPATVVAEVASTFQVLASDGALVRVLTLGRITVRSLRSSCTALGPSGTAICASWGHSCSSMPSKSVRTGHGVYNVRRR
jgi:hypothetical protein